MARRPKSHPIRRSRADDVVPGLDPLRTPPRPQHLRDDMAELPDGHQPGPEHFGTAAGAASRSAHNSGESNRQPQSALVVGLPALGGGDVLRAAAMGDVGRGTWPPSSVEPSAGSPPTSSPRASIISIWPLSPSRH